MNNLQLTKFKIGTTFVVCCLLFVAPLLSGAAGIVPCGGGGNEPDCNFNQLLILGNRIINFLLKDFAMPFAVLLIIWAGFLFMFKSSSSGTLEQAKGMFWNVVVGYIVALVAFLIIKLLLDSLGVVTPELKNILKN